MSATRQRTLNSGVQHVLEYLKRMQAENPAFFYAIQSYNDHSTGSIFWADPTSKVNYTYFGDAVKFNRTNHSRVPFASFSGLNHHGQPVLFGCALVINETESTFIWLFQTWMHAMSDRHPVSITTNLDGFVQAAVTQVFPGTCHRYCKYDIFSESREKLAHIYQSHPTFETEFKRCVNETDTIDEFVSAWQSLIHRYFVSDSEWLQSMFNAREQWVPVYLRNTFFGELSMTEEVGGLSSFFDGFVTVSTTPQMLIKQYEKALANWHERELKADYETGNTTPILKTPSPMEKQAANLYTRRIFMKFQDELVETLAYSATKVDDSGTITTYRVAKFGEDHKEHAVSFNSIDMKASCSCQMFEFSGIICRHVLAAFRAKNVLTLPSQYILQRWTRNAKSGAVLDAHASQMQNNSRESLTACYNSLRQEAIKFVEEGAKSIYIYNVAMNALQEAAKKIAAAKNQGSRASNSRDITNGSGPKLHATGENGLSASQLVDEKAKKIGELTEEIESTNQRCEVYRANLLSVLRDMEEQKMKLSVKVENARLTLKE
ncbi:hypothetical protein K2173_010600 [Erythroxylum novogranatense]|uniref:Protein FAR1-RELATED SEQUENCE n=1 Tax=Erythroxylum novogranatense TaxID=1862640 RepID=A0AAV8TFU1_9ROSI|nr:hypothetical protein K2173_010600 [Erythroxylum novogranatense]